MSRLGMQFHLFWQIKLPTLCLKFLKIKNKNKFWILSQKKKEAGICPGLSLRILNLKSG